MLNAASLALDGRSDRCSPRSAPPADRRSADAAAQQYRQAAGVALVGPADDASFLPRSARLAGATPPAADVLPFLADRDLNKREKLIDKLLDGDEFADH